VISFRRRLTAIVGALALTAGGLLLATTPASADSTTYSSITTYGSGMCLDDPGGSTANHEQMQIYYCNGGTNQQWTFVPGATPGYGELVNGASGKCLDVTAASTDDGIVIQQYGCGTGNNQQWSRDPNTGYVRALHSGKCLTVRSINYKTPTQQYSCGFYIDQWSFNP
jgi:hypothetical protein